MVEPEEWITITSLYLDRDFVADQVFWQYSAQFTDRSDAKQFLDGWYAEPARVLRLGENRSGLLMPWLDELVALCIDGVVPERFYRTQSLLYAVIDAVYPLMNVVDVGPSRRTNAHPAVPRHRQFAPVRQEARDAVEVLRRSLDERWTLDLLSEQVHLSSSQLGRVFTETFGKTPIAYLTMLRAERMAHLLRTTDEPIAAVARAVGWADPDYAGRLFKRNVGHTPRQYRALSRRLPDADQTGRFPR